MATTHYLLNVDLYDSLIGEFFSFKYPEYKIDIKLSKGVKIIK